MGNPSDVKTDIFCSGNKMYMSQKGKYSPEFKEQAVKRTLSGPFTIKEAAESLEIDYFVLRHWRTESLKKSEQQNPATDKQFKESEELRIYPKTSKEISHSVNS
ncbi:transposase [Leptospira borgpetersenii serovar Pomona str. 200901868]|uniref:Transposase n=4 Tax=Leptospira TaxID=171 RepID=M6W0Z8_LEPBO|nr:transposase [Leptospira borgpetersenii serovar Pomona str. 200901868]